MRTSSFGSSFLSSLLASIELPLGQIRTRTQRSDVCAGGRALGPESRLTMASYLLNIRTGDTPRPLFVVSVASYFIARKV